MAVLVTDAVANAWANHVVDDAGGVTAGRVGTAVVTVLATGLVAVSGRLWRHAGGDRSPGPRG